MARDRRPSCPLSILTVSMYYSRSVAWATVLSSEVTRGGAAGGWGGVAKQPHQKR